MAEYGGFLGRHYNESDRHHDYRRFIHDLSKKLSHENVQSISFLRHTSTDCYDYPACAHTAHSAHGTRTLGGPTNHGLHVLEHLWQSGFFAEGNLKPLENLLRDIGRHDLADECKEKGAKLGGCFDFHQFRPEVHHAPPMPRIPVPIPPTLITNSPDQLPPFYYSRDGASSKERTPAADDHDSGETRREIKESCSPQHLLSHTFPQTWPDHATTDPSDKSVKVNELNSTSSSRRDSVRKGAATTLSAIAPDTSQFGVENSVPSTNIPITFSVSEIGKLLQCIKDVADPQLMEKLKTAHLASSDGLHTETRDGESYKLPFINLPAPSTTVVTNSGKQMPNEATDFNSKEDLSTTNDQLTEKVVLRRQISVNHHVRSISTPIPAPLTPQPHSSHRRLEPCTSSSSTDSGLAQSHRSSTASNSSGSAFLSEDEEDKRDDREHEELVQTLSTSTSLSQLLSKDKETVSRETSQGCTLQEEEKDIVKRRGSADRRSTLTMKDRYRDKEMKQKLRRQSESTNVAMVDKRQRAETKKEPHSISRRRNRAISLPELSPPNPASKTGMTINWRIPRDDFIDPIFHHKNKCFDRKCRFSTGSGSSILNVHLAIKLYPNGINWDQGSYSTLKIELLEASRPPPCTAYILLDISGYDCHAGHMIASRQVEYPLRTKEYLIPEFLSHEVIKVSNVKNFEFRATIKVKYLLCSDWVVIPPDQFC